jgi:reactive intermediate/imine deaminase
MKRIILAGRPEPKGHYTPAMEAGGLIFASGLMPIDPVTGKAVDSSFEDQLKVLFANVTALLESAGCDRTDVVRANAYISSISLWDAFNSAYSAYFGAHKPARTVLPVGGKLHHGLDVEMDFVVERRK